MGLNTQHRTSKPIVHTLAGLNTLRGCTKQAAASGNSCIETAAAGQVAEEAVGIPVLAAGSPGIEAAVGAAARRSRHHTGSAAAAAGVVADHNNHHHNHYDVLLVSNLTMAVVLVVGLEQVAG